MCPRSVLTPVHKHYTSRVSHRAHSHEAGKSRFSVKSRSRVHFSVPTPTHCPLCHTASHDRSCFKCESCARPRALTHTNYIFAPHTICSPSKATGTLCVKRPAIATCDPPYLTTKSARAAPAPECNSCARPRALTHTNEHFRPDAAIARRASHFMFPV